MKAIWDDANKQLRVDSNRQLYTPRIFSNGYVLRDSQVDKKQKKSPRAVQESGPGEKMSYYIMPRFGLNLEKYFD